MASLQFDSEQRFTCSQCGRCCRRPWEIVVTPAEVEAYRQAKVARLFRETPEAAEGAARDPFEPIPRTLKFHRIRKRSDGACGFLSPQNRCRIHEELGGARKPLTCRMFPYRFHPIERSTVVTTSFCCPTTVANTGAALAQQRRDIAALHAEWFGVYPEDPRGVALATGRPLDEKSLKTLREALRRMLDRPGADGRPDLRANLVRIARTLDDLTRYRVSRLDAAAFAEYLKLIAGHAAASDTPVPPKPPGVFGRLMQRGFLFVVAATRLQVENQSWSGWRLGLRLRLFRLLAHFHGLGGAVSGIELRAARAVPVDVQDARLHPPAYHYLRSAIATLGTGRLPLLDELALSVSYLNAALALAAMRSRETGRAVDAEMFCEALMEAVDLTHADARGFLGRVLKAFAGGTEALYCFAEAGAAR